MAGCIKSGTWKEATEHKNNLKYHIASERQLSSNFTIPKDIGQSKTEVLVAKNEKRHWSNLGELRLVSSTQFHWKAKDYSSPDDQR